MFSRFVVASSLALLAVATPWGVPTETATSTVTLTVTAPAPTVTTVSQCNTGSIQCCQSVESANSAAGSALLGLLSIVLDDVNLLLGSDCSPLTVVGVGSGSSCDANPVCCTDNSYGNLISIGCVPISL
ncbi:fungal hydrophobin-domain-containing protein [Sparassis latifolia]|uniref:Hydrophobin n=1 Tax=Sparassis crispa TaxID=139825 RepID=A0A401GNB7_9APHY|nr:Fruiting body protein [Sparassis crispa]GBE83670.1 Fruiting body protein [Sparassis crispa]